ncbi:MAG: PKD domain-containing protein, partial [Flavobacterium sp.]
KSVRLASGKDTIFSIGKISWPSGSYAAVKITSTDTADNNVKNDSLTVRYRNGIGGVYTLGTGTSDYPDFASALKDLYKWGVCGKAIFKIADGVYEKQIEIQQIPGTGKNNQVIFESASGDSSTVVIKGFGPVLDFKGSDYVTFKGVTIQESEEYFYGQVIMLQKQATHNTIKNCLIIGDRSSYNSATWVIGDEGFGNDSNLIENNIIRFGVGSINLGNNPVFSKSTSYGNIIKGNIIDSSIATGLKLYYQEGLQLLKNTYLSTISGFDTAFYLNKCNNNVRIEGNYVNLKFGGSAIILDECEADNRSTRGVIANNMILIGENTGKHCYGLFLSSTRYFDILHNSIRIGKGNGNISSDLFFEVGHSSYYSTFHNIFNNIFINESNAYTLYITAHTSIRGDLIDSSDNNVFYSPNSGHIASNSLGTIAGWNSYSGFDSKSIFLNPKFTHKDSLFTYDTRLNAKGAPLTKVTNDIQGEKRSNTNPDIGADEFEPLKNDAFLEAVVYPTGIICKGFHETKVRVSNTGTDTLKNIIIGYNIDGVFHDTISYKLSIPTDRDSILSLGKLYYGDTLRWYKIFSSLPNNKFDRNQGNDTVLHAIRSALKDTYTVAKSGSYYNSLNMALSHLDSFGICGPVIFNIEDGYYEERLTINNYTGSSHRNSVTFQSSSGDSSKVWIEPKYSESTDSNYVVSANNAQNIIFKGITLSSVHTEDFTVVEIKNNASRIQLLNSQVMGLWDFYDHSSLIKTTQNCDSIVIKRNLINNGNNGIWLTGKSNTSRIKNVFIENNIFRDISNRNINLDHVSNAFILSNIIDSGSTGMELRDITDNLSIFKNYIYVNGGVGIYINGSVFTQSLPGRIENNMIVAEGLYGANGVSITSCLYIDVLHNSIKVNSPGKVSSAIFVYATSNSYYGHRLINNILVNIGTGYVIHIMPASASYTIPYSDYNSMYTNGKYIGSGKLGYSATLKGWVKDMKIDSHSINVLPVFRDSLDLHTQDISIDGKAKAITSVAYDIDNEQRSSTKPDIGADEFDPIGHDVAIIGFLPLTNSCADSVAHFGVILENRGGNNETNFKVNLNISGAESISIDSVYKANIISGQIDTLYFSKVFNTSKGGIYYVSAYHNLTRDLNTKNDSLNSIIKILKRQDPPIVNNINICRGNDVVLKPTKPSGIKLLWYSSVNQAIPILINDSLEIKNISIDTVIYVAAIDSIGCESYRKPINVTIKNRPENADLLKGVKFNGSFNRGTENNPDVVCEGSVNQYIIRHPKGFDNADYGKSWKISLIEIKGTNTNNIFSDTTVTWPSVSDSGKIEIKPAVTGTDKSFRIKIIFSNLSNGCDTILERYFDVFALPKAKWNINSACENDLVNFTDSSSNANAYLWKFSDGSTSTKKNPSYLFTKAGNYDVSLVVFNYWGCTDSLKKSLVIHPMPEVDFQIPTSICAGENFTSSNRAKNNGSLSYNWNFDDNTSSTDSTTTHTYYNSGIYAVRLTGISVKGCSKTETKYIQVYDKPEAAFAIPDSVCVGTNLTFFNKSQRAVSYLWTFSTGDTSSAKSASFTFTKAGSYSVTLNAYNASNCSDTLKKNVIVLPVPEAKFEVTDICLGDSVKLNNKSKISGQRNLTYFWRFGDGSTSAFINPVHIYTKSGIYNITLIASSESGCKDSVTKKVRVGSIPNAEFDFSGACVNDNFIFTDLSTDFGNKVASRKWDFGNGKTSTDSVVQVKFNMPGKYIVKLEAISSFGCTTTKVDTVEVYDLPTVAYKADTFCAGLTLSFTNTSKGNISSMWHFGDGDSSDSHSPVHNYKSAGKYVVSLSVKSLHGCVSALADTIVVNDITKASFKANTVCANEKTSFVNTSTAYSSCRWNFGDGDSSTSISPIHKYKSAGNYVVHLFIVSTRGCIDTITQAVKVWELPSSEFDFTIGSNRNVSFFPDSKSYKSYHWDFDDGFTSDSISQTHKFGSDGNYTVLLATKNISGCTDTIRKKVNVTTVGINKASDINDGLEVFPNPFMNAFTVKYSLPYSKNVDMILFDILGKEVMHKNFGNLPPGNYNQTLKTDLPAGTYILHILLDEKMITRKIVKLN